MKRENNYQKNILKLLCFCLVFGLLSGCTKNTPKNNTSSFNDTSNTTYEDSSLESSEFTDQKEIMQTEESAPQTVKTEETEPKEIKAEESGVPDVAGDVSLPAESLPPAEPEFTFSGGKSNTDIENNDFLDAMVYCGYNLQKHRADGLMWKYILCADKPQRGWLSKITYGGGSTGYEKTADGKPDIASFEKGGLVCATYATYVYFNYLPSVAGIDTSKLDRPKKSYDANDWYIAGQAWVKKGYSRYIGFTAKENGTRTVFNPTEPVPIGSLMILTDFKHRTNHCTHICLYAGYANGYHWVTHVGNANGPEFCAMERMSCGPDPQWPIKIITTPKGIVK